jgi:hypothetical protein
MSSRPSVIFKLLVHVVIEWLRESGQRLAGYQMPAVTPAVCEG